MVSEVGSDFPLDGIFQRLRSFSSIYKRGDLHVGPLFENREWNLSEKKKMSESFGGWPSRSRKISASSLCVVDDRT